MKKALIDFEIDPLWKVSEVRRCLVERDVFRIPPTQQTLVNYILDGTLDGFQSDKGHYFIRQKSLIAWIKSLQEKE